MRCAGSTENDFYIRPPKPHLRQPIRSVSGQLRQRATRGSLVGSKRRRTLHVLWRVNWPSTSLPTVRCRPHVFATRSRGRCCDTLVGHLHAVIATSPDIDPSLNIVKHAYCWRPDNCNSEEMPSNCCTMFIRCPPRIQDVAGLLAEVLENPPTTQLKRRNPTISVTDAGALIMPRRPADLNCKASAFNACQALQREYGMLLRAIAIRR